MDTKNKYGTLEMQKDLLRLLKTFDDICRQNSIKYSLSNGSLLGAVRHQGFIPWDDDLDCIMRREDFAVFKKAIEGNDVLHLSNAPESYQWTERVRLCKPQYKHIFTPTLDVFFLDNCPDSEIKRNVKLLAIKMLQGMIKYEMSSKGPVLIKICSLITHLAGRLFSKERKYSWYNKVAQWGNGTTSKYLSAYHDQYFGLHLRYPREIIQNVIRMPFEDITVYGLAEYDKYLKIVYGDNYMTPPSEESRKPLHIG